MQIPLVPPGLWIDHSIVLRIDLPRKMDAHRKLPAGLGRDVVVSNDDLPDSSHDGSRQIRPGGIDRRNREYATSFPPVPLRIKPVSYTHLRAHETRHDLVCRLLLEKKKKKNKDRLIIIY